MLKIEETKEPHLLFAEDNIFQITHFDKYIIYEKVKDKIPSI
jgi:hypothetical protein